MALLSPVSTKAKEIEIEGKGEREGSYTVVKTYTLVEQHFHYKHTREYYQKTSPKQSKLIIHLQYFLGGFTHAYRLSRCVIEYTLGEERLLMASEEKGR